MPSGRATGGKISVRTLRRGGIEAVRKLVKAKLYKCWGKTFSKGEEVFFRKFGISIMAGKGLGKDALASWLICWFMVCFPNCKIPCTSVSADQLNKVLWSELSK